MFRLHWLVIDLRENRNLGLLSHVYMCNGRRDAHSRACSPRTVPARTVESVYGDHAQGTCRRVCGIMRHPGHVYTGDQAFQAQTQAHTCMFPTYGPGAHS